jgi:Domain of unknown function (DU1801)
VPTRRASDKPADGESRTDPDVVAFLRELDHPLKREIEVVRKIILGASPAIREGIKWNAPSFRTTDYFATLNLRGKGDAARVWLILHTGAKAKGHALQGKIADPTGLLKWLAKDRALVIFADGKDLKAKKKALEAVVREWVATIAMG